jgi:hypothetical protein
MMPFKRTSTPRYSPRNPLHGPWPCVRTRRLTDPACGHGQREFLDGLRKNTTKELEAVRALIEKEKLILKKEKKMVKEIKKGQSSRVKLNIGGHKVYHSPQFNSSPPRRMPGFFVDNSTLGPLPHLFSSRRRSQR